MSNCLLEKCSFHPFQRCFFLIQVDSITESTTDQNAGTTDYKGPPFPLSSTFAASCCPKPNWYIYNTTSTLKTQGTSWGGDHVRVRGPGPGPSWETVSSRCDREAALIKSQQDDYANRTCIMTTPADMPTWIRELELQAASGCWERQSRHSHLDRSSSPKWSALNIYT